MFAVTSGACAQSKLCMALLVFHGAFQGLSRGLWRRRVQKLRTELGRPSLLVTEKAESSRTVEPESARVCEGRFV